MNSEGGVLIKAQNIQQTFVIGESSAEVIRQCNFELREKSFNIIFGPSGSGKSTLLNIISGLQKPSSGELLYKGQDLYKLSSAALANFRSSEVGIVYQSEFWVSSLSVIENVAMPLYFAGHSRQSARRLAQDALQRVDMGTAANKSPLVLSGGEQQRVGIARAIVNDPPLIIADEPTGSLDSKNGDMIMSLLQSFKRDLNRTIILVTHNMEYLSMADHLLNIHDGNVDDLADDNIAATTEKLVDDMRARIDRFAQLKTSKNSVVVQ